jgi:hypothetical protein
MAVNPSSMGSRALLEDVSGGMEDIYADWAVGVHLRIHSPLQNSGEEEIMPQVNRSNIISASQNPSRLTYPTVGLWDLPMEPEALTTYFGD